MEQGSLEWFKDRIGKITSTMALDIYNANPNKWRSMLAKMKRETSWTEAEIVEAQIKAEELGNKIPAMRRGKELESRAIGLWEMGEVGVEVVVSPGTHHPDYPFCRASEDFGGTKIEAEQKLSISGEVKTRSSYKEAEKRRKHGAQAAEYTQLQWHGWCRQSDLLVYIDYCPDHPIKKDVLFVEYHSPDMDMWDQFERNAKKFYEHFQKGTDPEDNSGQRAVDGLPAMH